ncbi:CAP domain-containing protein [Deinococcus irradiatisoli]|nr:CAP domain-containing protein [Deinococcus irradiatisoli]
MRKGLWGLLALTWLGQAQAVGSESALLSGVNALRAQGIRCAGTPRPRSAPLTFMSAQAAAARVQASYMAQTGRISHTGAGGTSPRVRAASAGVRGSSMSEIIYLSPGLNAQQAVNWWRNSAVHCFAMTDPRYTKAGMSIVRGARGTAYVMVLSN